MSRVSPARTAIVIPRSEPPLEDLERDARAGARPRRDYVLLARKLGADVVDSHWLAARGTRAARAVSSRRGIPEALAVEAFLRRRQFDRLLVWSDRLGLMLAMVFKLSRSQQRLVVMSIALATARRSLFLKHLRAHSHLSAIVSYGSMQLEIAAGLGVPREKLHLALQPVDDLFWRPHEDRAAESAVVVGWWERDYETLFAAVTGLNLPVEIALGSTGPRVPGSAVGDLRAAAPPNVRFHYDLSPPDLRDLYANARFVIVPLRDVEYDAGVTVLTEAMAMGKAIVVTRTRGQVDVVDDGVQGFYVPPSDPIALRRRIDELDANEPLAKRMGTAARARVEAHHRLDDYVARVADIVSSAPSPS